MANYPNLKAIIRRTAILNISVLFCAVSCSYQKDVIIRSDASVLNLSSSGLKRVPEKINGLTFLRELNLFRNKIDSIPGFIGTLQRLDKLSVQSNDLVFISDSIRYLQSLKHLNLRFNKLSKLPDGISLLKSLEYLDLRNNRIEKLPENLGSMIKLEQLFLSDNNITHIPESMVSLANLRILHIGKNSIEGDLPEFIGQLTELIELDVSGCCTGNRLPDELKNLKKLEVLYISPYQILPNDIGRGSQRLRIEIR